MNADPLTGYRNIPSNRVSHSHHDYDEWRDDQTPFEPGIDNYYEQLREARQNRDRCIAEARAWSRSVVRAVEGLRKLGVDAAQDERRAR